jgi:hypothetical protein
MAAEACRTGKMLAARITRSLMTQRSYPPSGQPLRAHSTRPRRETGQ